MTTNFPNGIDNYVNPTSSSYLNSPSHSEQHSNLNDAMKEVQKRLGVSGSTIPTSIDYELHNPEHGHDHNGENSRPIKLGASGSNCDFSEGLFQSWTTQTVTGEAICQINKVLKGLAPGPAPSLTSISSSNIGVSGKLSFGSSQSISDYENVVGTGSIPATDINEDYLFAFYSDNVVLGIFDAVTNITGFLNPSTTDGLPNYPSSSFNDNGGEIILELNSVPFLSANMSLTSGTINSTSSNGSYLFLSASSPAQFENGTGTLDEFQHRRGHFNINFTDQRKGWNYVKFLHLANPNDFSSIRSTTNIISWVVDDDTTNLTASSGSLHTPILSGLRQLTGVKYFTNGTATYQTAITSAYKNTYSRGNTISFNGGNMSFSSQALSGINIGLEDENKIEYINKTGTIVGDKLVPGTLTASINCSHPLGPNLSNAGISFIGEILLYDKVENSTVLRDRFQDENYRLLPSSGSNDYDLQTDIPVSGFDSTYNWSGSLEQLPLIVYNDSLNALPNLPDSGNGPGDFTNFKYSPNDNVDYSIFSGNLYYYRKFINNTGGSQSNFQIHLTGSGTIVTSSLSLGPNDNFLLEFKLPEQTGWNVFSPFELLGNPQIPDDGAGILDGAFDDSLNSSLKGTFGSLFVANDDHIVMRITSDSQWTGQITDVRLVWI